MRAHSVQGIGSKVIFEYRIPSLQQQTSPKSGYSAFPVPPQSISISRLPCWFQPVVLSLEDLLLWTSGLEPLPALLRIPAPTDQLWSVSMKSPCCRCCLQKPQSFAVFLNTADPSVHLLHFTSQGNVDNECANYKCISSVAAAQNWPVMEMHTSVCR